MRLLKCTSAGKFTLTKDFIRDDEVPSYTILSHTWSEGEEVTFEDLISDTGKDKLGYNKILFCGERTSHDGLQYFWVDTCCIDKSNSVELQEAINSMFRWYSKAEKCYVYLSDVSSSALDTNDELSPLSYESAFRKSRWFGRGWTLQELLAPHSVEFFSREGNFLGNRTSLETKIHEITGIAVEALRGASLSHFDNDERLSWAQHRQTTRQEDRAYSLLGIFGVYMPLIYGEGKDNALKRLLKEVYNPLQGPDRLPHAIEAPFNSSAKQHLSLCLPDTRVELLGKIERWADGRNERRVFWLNGLAGTGKSTISRTISRKWYDRGRLGASFFFSRGGGDISHARKFVTSIAMQLAINVPRLYRFICDTIAESSDLANRSLREQWDLLVLKPLSKLDDDSSCTSYILVVDALDECDDNKDIDIILQLLAETKPLQTVRLQLFLTSRPEITIRHGFGQMPKTEYQDFVLHNISQSIVDYDIGVFLEHNFRNIRKERRLGDDWPGENAIETLVRNACGLFIWAETACQFIRQGKLFAKTRLATLLGNSGANSTQPEKHLNQLYNTVLKQTISPDFADDERLEFYAMLRHTLGSLVVLQSPLSSSSFCRLLDLQQEDVDQMLEDLHTILDIPDDPTQPIYLHHPSFRDFLLDKTRCEDPNFWVDEKEAHQTLAEKCILIMSTFLKKDICELGATCVLVTEIESDRLEQCLSPDVQYACLYWVEHLQRGGFQPNENGQVHQFLQGHFLYWLEAMSLMGKTAEAVLAVTSLESMAVAKVNSALYKFVYDAKRFTLHNRSIIEAAPLQVYCSALVFTPELSVIREQFEGQIPGWFRGQPTAQKDWSLLEQALEGHSDWARGVVFSPDGSKLASASGDRTIRLWNVTTGEAERTFQGHSGWVRSIAFSPDGNKLASASGDRTVRLWNVTTGRVEQILDGHLGSVRSVIFSPSGEKLASSSSDRTVRVWDTVTGDAKRTFKGHSDWVGSIVFSPDGHKIASSSGDETIRVWDITTGQAEQVFEGHSGSVRGITFSPDGRKLASASGDRTIRIWNVATGQAEKILKGHSGWVRTVVYSPDGKKLASASGDRTVRIWDVTTGAIKQTLQRHSSWVRHIVFSPDGSILASASGDKTICLWNADTGKVERILEGHLSSVRSIAFSPDGRRLASESGDRTVKIWNITLGEAEKSFKSYENPVRSIVFSSDGSKLASISGDQTIQVWAVTKGQVEQTIEGHFGWVDNVVFSPDSSTVVLVSGEKMQLWNIATMQAKQMIKGHAKSINVVAFSPDGKVLASVSEDKTVKLWHADTGGTLQTLENHASRIHNVTFSPNSALLASTSDDNVIKLWNVLTGAVNTFDSHTDSVYSIAFSPDGKRLASASLDKTIKLWDTTTAAAINTIKVDSFIRSMVFSLDGKWLDMNHELFQLDKLEVQNTLCIPEQLSSQPGLSVNANWVIWNSEKVLWLPREYQGSCVASRANVLALGHQDGRVTIIEFR